MTIHTGARMSADAIRGYVKTLRRERKKTQPDVAKHIDMPLSTYKDWERGITKDIKTPHLVRIIRFLKGSFDQIAELSDKSTIEDGEVLAKDWVTRQQVVDAFAPTSNETPQEESRVNRLIDLLEAGIDAQEAARIVKRGG